MRTVHCIVKCSLQCSLYYLIWPILQYKAKLSVGTLNRRQGVYIFLKKYAIPFYLLLQQDLQYSVE